MALIYGAVSATVAETGGLQSITSRGGSEARSQAAELSASGGDWTKEEGAAYPCGASGWAKYWGGERGGAVGGRGGRKNQCRPAGSGCGHLVGTEGTGRSDRQYTISHVPQDRPRVSLYDDKAVESPPSTGLQSLAVAPPALPRPPSFLLL